MRAPRALIQSVLIPAIPLLAACAGAADQGRDPLASEIERWSAFLESRPAEDKLRQDTGPALARAEEALA
ncbi:MAG: hypothetical protein ACLGI9_03935, partial [Thermoanaerobaculia bacterium]